MPPGAAQEGLEPGGGEDLLGGPQPRRGERQPAASEGKATAPLLAAPESGGEEGKADPPLVEEPPSKEGACSAKEAVGREGAQWGHTPACGRNCQGDLTPGEGPTFERAGHKWEKREPGRRGGERRGGQNRGRRMKRAQGPTAKPAWEWILLALCLWGALQMGAACWRPGPK